MKPRRKGNVSEYQNGHYFLYVTEWDAAEDGAGRRHVKIEVFYAKARLLWNSTDPNKIEDAKKIFLADPIAFQQTSEAGELPPNIRKLGEPE